jgi:DNA primase
VSPPIDWSEIDTLARSAHWTIANIDSRLATGNSPGKPIHGLAGAMNDASLRTQENIGIV